MLLDEPTNDLDLDGLARLEDVVRGLRGGVVLVSRPGFLSRSVTRVLELDLAQHTNTVYGGGYDSYLDERDVARRHKREAYEEFAEQKADLVARPENNANGRARACATRCVNPDNDNDKIRRRAATESSEKQAQKVRQMESRIARLDEVEEPRRGNGSSNSRSVPLAIELGGRHLNNAVCGSEISPSAVSPGERGRTDRHHRQRCRKSHAQSPVVSQRTRTRERPPGTMSPSAKSTRRVANSTDPRN